MPGTKRGDSMKILKRKQKVQTAPPEALAVPGGRNILPWEGTAAQGAMERRLYEQLRARVPIIDSAIGKLMHDFNCADADDMHYGLLAERTRYLKENSKGVNEMYRTMDEVEKECYEEGREKGRETQAELTAINLRKLGLPLEQIAHAVGFHVEKVEKWVK